MKSRYTGNRNLSHAARAFDVLALLSIFRRVGRKPSAVYLDETMHPTALVSPHRLKDRVYRWDRAQPGDQIQERFGGVCLVTADGDCHLIRLLKPRPLQVATCLAIAATELRRDRRVLDLYAAAGKLALTKPCAPRRRPEMQDAMLDERHPLVMSEAAGIGAEVA